MRIFETEKKLGLEHKILASCISKAFCPVKPTKKPNRVAEIQHAFEEYQKTKAGKSVATYNDLYYCDTVLVTSNFNKNDDFFAAEEVWRSRATPVDKPVNIGHIPDLVVGHMTRSWVLTAGKKRVIPNSTAENSLPNLIHLACAAVVYRELESLYSAAIAKLIVDIEAGEMAVSMEAHFDDFDYALLSEATGSIKLVSRNEETAWMTGLLRWFGGEGVYTSKKDGKVEEIYRIGRALKGITFTGKGFVKNPANPDSIILNKSFEPLSAAEDKSKVAAFNHVAGKIRIGSFTTKENTKMADIDPKEYATVLATAQNADKLSKENEKLQAKVETLTDALAKANQAKSEFELGKKEYMQLLEAAKKENEEKDKKMKDQADLIEAVKKSKEEDDKKMKDKESKCEQLEKELADLKAAQVAAERQALLLKEGIEAKDAEAFIKTMTGFGDDQFKVMATSYIDAHKAKLAVQQMVKDGKVTAEALDKMTPKEETTPSSNITKAEGETTSKGGSVFASLGNAMPVKK